MFKRFIKVKPTTKPAPKSIPSQGGGVRSLNPTKPINPYGKEFEQMEELLKFKRLLEKQNIDYELNIDNQSIAIKKDEILAVVFQMKHLNALELYFANDCSIEVIKNKNAIDTLEMLYKEVLNEN